MVSSLGTSAACSFGTGCNMEQTVSLPMIYGFSINAKLQPHNGGMGIAIHTREKCGSSVFKSPSGCMTQGGV